MVICRFAAMSWMLLCFLLGVCGVGAGQDDNSSRQLDTFQRQQLTDTYFSEGVAFGDLDQDGHQDVVYGPHWFAGPDFKLKYTIYPPVPQNREAYADHFFAWVHDFNQDDAPDVLVVGFPGTPAYVYQNPGAPEQVERWEKHEVLDWVSNESPQFVDLVGDEQPELVCTRDGFFGFATFDSSRPFEAWKFHPISEQIAAPRFGHGLGIGDVNGDGRPDILYPQGWFEQPAEQALDGRWRLHPASFTTAYGGAEMHTYDVDGDGDQDVITSEAAHEFGLSWYEQVGEEGGEPTFKQHVIMGSHPAENTYGVLFSELHSVQLADIDGDGLQDIVTGKTYYSHHRQSPLWDAGAVVYWFRLVRDEQQGVQWIPYQADREAGIGRQLVIGDLNGDGLSDLVMGGMKGAHVLLHERQSVDPATWKAAQPEPYAGEPKPSTEGAQSRRGPAAIMDADGGQWKAPENAVVIEGEAVKPQVSAGSVARQDMGAFPQATWSQGAQAFWRGGREGDRITLEVPEMQGTYDLQLVLTCAPDFGIVELRLDDQLLGPPIDLYEPQVVTTGVLTFEELTLEPGEHTLQIRLLGKNPKSRGMLVGLDAFCFVPRTDVSPQEPAFDVVIDGGRIIDGTGAPWFRADLGIRDGRIVAIGQLSPADGREVIDASGLAVAPGFVDMMGQTATVMMERPQQALNLLTQGITTINSGEGGSAAPLAESEDGSRGWTTMREYLALLEMRGLPVNVVQTIGHTQVRRLVIGEDQRRPSPAELERMQEYVREAMQAGAIGVSTALIYPPAVYANTEEIAALAEIAGQHGGRYFTHMRNEGDQLLEAIDEALEIGREGDASVHIFHLKAAGQQNWPKMELALEKIRAARNAGQHVTADIYPYINNGLGIAALIHPRHFTDGYDALRARIDDPALRQTIRQEMEQTDGWENWYRHVGYDWKKIIIGQTDHPRYSPHAGKSLGEIAELEQQDAWDVFFALVKTGAFALPESMSEANKRLAMQAPFISFCTDVGPASGSQIAAHPRAFGSFPRLLGRYVREQQVLSLEQAVAQASAAACNAIMVYDRGRLAEGLVADIIVFDPESVEDRATFESPDQLSQGVKYVLVNGQLVLRDGEYTGARPGRVLRGPGYREDQAPAAIVTGPHVPETEAFDDMLEGFIHEHRVVGAAIAVTDEGRLVHARGYGYADLGQRQPASHETLFRIASISKPVTAVAILQLVERGQLQLEQTVAEVLDWDQALDDLGSSADPRLREITIEQLLEHRGGWDRSQSFDAMFRSVAFAHQFNLPAPAGSDTVIRAMFTQPLDFDPGARYAYSNFGYCLLGRVIEKVSGQSYETYVQEQVLEPLGITGMRLGRTRLPNRSTGETRYYHPGRNPSVFENDLDQPVPAPYGAWYVEAMDSHGGWLASVVDLARFATAFDDPENCPILSAESIRRMHQRPPGDAGYDEQGNPKPVYYSLGWLNRALPNGQLNHWHTGSLPGTAAILIRRADGRNFVALFNGRVSPTANHLGRTIDPLLHRAAIEVEDWPEHDLFPDLR